MAFVVDEADLRRLDAVLSSFVSNHSYRLKTSNDIETDLATLDDVLSQPNSAVRRFVSLTGTTPWRSENRLTVTLREGDFGNVKYEVVGDDKEVFDAANRLDEWIDEVRPWYSRIATADFLLLVMWFWMVAFAGLLAVTAIYSIVGLLTTPAAQLAEPVPQTTRGVYLQGAVLGVLVLSLVGAWVAGAVRRPLFPVATFRMGGGRKRDDTARFWRVLLGGSVALPVVLAVLLGWLVPQ